MQITLDPDAFAPLIRQVVEATILKLDEIRKPFGDRLAYSEAEAAALLGLQEHVLRDERKRGRIAATQISNRRVRYVHGDLLAYLLRHRREAT